MNKERKKDSATGSQIEKWRDRESVREKERDSEWRCFFFFLLIYMRMQCITYSTCFRPSFLFLCNPKPYSALHSNSKNSSSNSNRDGDVTVHHGTLVAIDVYKRNADIVSSEKLWMTSRILSSCLSVLPMQGNFRLIFFGVDFGVTILIVPVYICNFRLR